MSIQSSMSIQSPEQIANDTYWTAPEFPDIPNKLRALMAAAVRADRAQRADDIDLPEPWSTTLHVIEGDGEEYTDTVQITFTREWDASLTRSHVVTWETFVKVLAVVAREEATA